MNKICNFYVNDTHLNVTLFEYIRKQVDEGIKIIIISQDTPGIKIKDIKEKFKNKSIASKIDFLSEDSINKLCQNEKISIIIKGDNNFINKIENSFIDLFKNENKNINILSCYDIKNLNVSLISNKYNQILSTRGICNLGKIDENNLQKI